MNDDQSHLDASSTSRTSAVSASRTLIVVCTYNELASLPSLVDAIQQVVPTCDLLVIDDNSPDGTSDWMREQTERDPKLMLECRPGKLGLGSAIKFGIERGIANGYDWIINLDADWSHDPAAIPMLLEARLTPTGLSDMVIGSRYIQGGGMQNCTWRRHVVRDRKSVV